MQNEKASVRNIALLSIMLCFFTMGFCDLIGTASDWMQKSLSLTGLQKGFLAYFLFIWFLIFSVPAGLLMDRIGRKKTVLLSLLITVVSLALPIFGESYALMAVAFSLLGIGNTLLQTSLNPLLSDVVSGNKLASSMTFGQFVKAISSASAPLIADWGASATEATFGLGWRVLFPIYMVVAVLVIILLNLTRIDEQTEGEKPSTFTECFSLLGKPFILLCFLGIFCHVGIDVGVNTTAKPILEEHVENGFFNIITWYFVFRTIGAFSGAFILQKLSPKRFLAVSVLIMVVALVGLCFAKSEAAIYTCIALMGLGNSNVFSIIFSEALIYMPEKKNAISGLMIMGLIGGAIFPPVMGWVSDLLGSQVGAILVILVGPIYLWFLMMKLKERKAA